MEAMRTASLRLRRHKPKLPVIDDAVHDGNLRDEGDDLHPAALMEAMSTAGLPHRGQTSRSTS
jgi:hypothetical protein